MGAQVWNRILFSLLLVFPVAQALDREETVLEQAKLSFSEHKYEEAVRILEPLKEGPQAQQALYFLVQSYMALGQGEACKQVFLELADRYPDSPWLHELYGLAYDEQGFPEEALKEFEAALRIQPDLPNANFAIGFIFWKQKKLAESRPWLVKETLVQPCHAPAHYYIGAIDQELGKSPSALAEFKSATKCDPEFPDPHLGIGRMLERQGHLQEAKNEFQLSVQIAPDNANAHYLLAAVLRRLGQTSQATKELAAVRKIHSDSLAKARDLFR